MVAADFKIVCPCCQSKILVDYKAGAVISHEELPGKASPTFEQAVAQNAKRKSDAEDAFAQAVREHENKEELLEKKFKEAFEKADKTDTPPPHPFDYD
ncbi:MAG: hypothetical protein BMS9Abin37_1131 [Acidobacteriota bacterium]|nr:MAG: hypothetical protein BMS9Abin37_1131 [Acidobacteriota bacterium]